MRLKLHFLFLFVFIIIIENTVSKESNKTKLVAAFHKKYNISKDKSTLNRNKRSTEDDEEIPFWASRGRRFAISNNGKSISVIGRNERALDDDEEEQIPPFWANRGRRGGSSENILNGELPSSPQTSCTQCHKLLKEDYGDDLDIPFWASRGRRNSDKGNDEDLPKPFWASRGRRLEAEPFWELRDRRQEEEEIPFWASRGRRNSLGQRLTKNGEPPVWESRVSADEQPPPFWESRGRREESLGNHEQPPPFWGSRGRREESSGNHEQPPPFWGSRGRRDDASENDELPPPFWGSRGRRDDYSDGPFWASRGRRITKNSRRENLKHFLHDAITKVEDNIDNLLRNRRDDSTTNSFWNNRGRDSQMKYLFKGRHRFQTPGFLSKTEAYNPKPSESSTVLDDRIFAEQPHYILVERSSRSSGEDDPFFISRGKKQFINSASKAARDRRGAIEELVKTVRNDPYYIARGKKDTQINKAGNSSLLGNELGKAKELICATIDLILVKNNGAKAKRELNENERDRRTILKKLAAQLQMDPYFVSRGKKNESGIDENNIQDFISEVSTKCN